MALFDALFRKREGKTVALIDVSPDSVAGAYVHYQAGAVPLLVYTRRLPVEHRQGEPLEDALLRALDVLGEALIREGAPAVLRATGSGSAHEAVVAIDAPWQEVRVRTESIEREKPFTFTESLVHTVLARTRTDVPDKVLADERIIGSKLNGYETRTPYGKEARRASVTILSSYIDQRVVDAVAARTRQLFHMRSVRTVATCALRSEAVRIAFPHQPDALLLEVSSVAISLVLIQDGSFAAVSTILRNPNATHWVHDVLAQFAEIAKRFPLPRTIFLVAPEDKVGALRNALPPAELAALWLSDNPPTIVSVLPSHVAGLVNLCASAAPDLPLLLMALYGSAKDLSP